MEKLVSDKNTKTQILEAYERLLKDVEQKSMDNPKEMQQRKDEAQIVKQASDTTAESIPGEIGVIKTEFLSSLDKIERELVAGRKKLGEIQQAVQIEEKYLKDLYGLTANVDAFSAILLAQKEQKEQFEQDMKCRKELLIGQIEEMRKQWEKEKAQYDEVLRAEKAERTKLQKREEEDYTYTVQQKRKQEQDEYDQQKNKQDAALKDQRAAFDKEFADREASLVGREKELNDLHAEVESFSRQLASAVQKSESDTEARLKLIHKYETDLQEKETQGILNLKDHQISSLESKIKEMEVQLKEAGTKVDTSEKTVKDIALKAIENVTKTQIIEKERVRD